MPAYPFTQSPTTDQFVEKLCELGATAETTREIVGPRGKVAFRYMKRVTDSGVRLSENLAEDGGEHVGWDKLRRVCRQLGLDPRDLHIRGLHLG